MPKGAIRRLNKDRGFGFIKTEHGKSFIFHHSKLQSVDFNSLREGQGVEFEVGKRCNGRSQAVKVKLLQSKDI
jgi:cold shock CspA family protein